MQINKVQIRFMILLVVIYILLDNFVKFWIGICAPGGYYWGFAEDHLNFVLWYRELLIFTATQVIQLFGLISIHNGTSIRIIGHGGIQIVYSCLGFGIMSLLIALGIAVPGKKIKERLLFVGVGILLFFLLNVIRLFVICYYANRAVHLGIDHHLIFNGLCYIIIFASMYIWIRKGTQTTETYES